MEGGGEGMMTPPRDPQPRHVRDRVRYQARLDAETQAKLEELAAAFHRKRSAILRHAMPWGLTRTRGWTVDRAVPGTVRTVGMRLEPELLQQVQEAAAAHGTTVAAWVRHTLQQVTIEDFLESWRLGVAGVRSHESGYDQRRFMLCLDETTTQKLQQLVEQFGMSRAEIIRQLIAQAKAEDFPPSWHFAVAERRNERPQRGSG
jgi:predicted transcriptional regulator